MIFICSQNLSFQGPINSYPNHLQLVAAPQEYELQYNYSIVIEILSKRPRKGIPSLGRHKFYSIICRL